MYSKSYGLNRKCARTLRALFEAAQASTEPPSWVHSRSNQAALAGLLGAGLVSEKARLTLAGLAIATNLPALERSRWLEAA